MCAGAFHLLRDGYGQTDVDSDKCTRELVARYWRVV